MEIAETVWKPCRNRYRNLRWCRGLGVQFRGTATAEAQNERTRRGFLVLCLCSTPPPLTVLYSPWLATRVRATTRSRTIGVARLPGPRGKACSREAQMHLMSFSPQSSKSPGKQSRSESRRSWRNWAARSTTPTQTTRRARGPQTTG